MHEIGNFRDIRESDLEDVLRWRNHPKVRENMYTRHEISIDEHMHWWESTKNRSDQIYYIYESLGNKFGVVSFSQINMKDMNCSWAFYASDLAQRGMGSRMEYLALEYAFDNLNMHKLHCEVLSFNTSVVGLHQKFGFQIEGVLREHHKVDSEYVDIVKLGILSREWDANREKMLRKIAGKSA